MTTVQDHVNAALALLRADTALTVFDGKADDAATNYVLVYSFRQMPDGGVAPDRISLTGASSAVDMRLYCHCVGSTAAAARWVQDRVQAALLDTVPTVATRSCSPIRWLDGTDSSRDQETLVAVFDQVDVYGWSSYPA